MNEVHHVPDRGYVLEKPSGTPWTVHLPVIEISSES